MIIIEEILVIIELNRRASGYLQQHQWDTLTQNQWATAMLSPALTHFLPPDGMLYLKLQQFLNAVKTSPNEPPPLITPRHPGPKTLRRSIPLEEWPTVVRRVVEDQELLRKVDLFLKGLDLLLQGLHRRNGLLESLRKSSLARHDC